MSTDPYPEVSVDESGIVPPQGARTSEWPKKLRTLTAAELDRLTIDDSGRLVHERGVTASPGLFFVGLTWQHTRGSALLGWVKDDAEFITNRIGASMTKTSHDFPTDTIIWAIWAIVYQQIENNVIQPQIQRRTVQVQPIEQS